MAAAGGISDASGRPGVIGASDRPRLMPGCRLSESQGETATLMVPEGAVRLNAPAFKIVSYCNGARTFTEIVNLLAPQFSGADRARIEQDTANLLEQLKAKRVVTWENG